MTDFDFSTDTLRRFLDRMASDAPAPGGGAAAAVGTAMAGGLIAMVARFSDAEVPDVAAVIGEADKLVDHALDLARRDAEAYSEVLAAYRLPKGSDGRSEQIRGTLAAAAEVPAAITEAAAGVAALAQRLARHANPNLQGDRIMALLLADASAQGAAALVELNVTLGRLEGDWLARVARATTATARARSEAP